MLKYCADNQASDALIQGGVCLGPDPPAAAQNNLEHFQRKASTGGRPSLNDDMLLVHIKAIHAQAKQSYGWPRIWKELLARGTRVGKNGYAN